MKKYAFVTLTALAMLLVGGCGDSEPQEKDEAKNATVNQAVESENGELSVDKGLLNVEVTMPAELLEDTDEASLIADAKEKGVKDVKVNEDGSITYKMSKAKHKEMLKEMKAEMETSIAELTAETASLQKVDFNKDFTKFKVTVERAAFEDSFDGFTLVGLGIMSAYYSAFNGATNENFKVTFDMYDAATDEKYDTVVLPEESEEDKEA